MSVIVSDAAQYSLCEYNDLLKLNGLALDAGKMGGVIVECGVYKGGSALVLSNSGLPLYLFDSFEKMEDGSKEDTDWDNKVSWNTGVSVDSVRKLFKTFNVENYNLIVGWFANTLPVVTFGKDISLLHLDVDLYDAYMDCLSTLYYHVKPGGIVVLDDYFTYEGCRKAVKDIFINPPEIKKLGAYSGYFIKE